MHSHSFRSATGALPNILPNVCAYQQQSVAARESSAPLQTRAHRLTAAYAKLPAQNSASLRFGQTTSHQAHTLDEIRLFNKISLKVNKQYSKGGDLIERTF